MRFVLALASAEESGEAVGPAALSPLRLLLVEAQCLISAGTLTALGKRSC